MQVNYKTKGVFTRFAQTVSKWAGSASVFCMALVVIVVWGVTGPLFHYSDTWQLVINTSTTIVTFLMVFLIQNTQNRDAQALQLKLDELLRASKGAHLSLLDLEELSDKELAEIRKMYRELAEYGRSQLAKGETDGSQRELSKQEYLESNKAYKRAHRPLHERLAKDSTSK